MFARRHPLLLAALAVLALPSIARATWAPNGNPIKTGAGEVNNVTVLADAASGAYIAWQDTRNGAGNNDVFVTRVNSTGDFVAGWGGAGGVDISPVAGDQVRPRLALDGAGGVYVIWQDGRPGVAGIYVQRLTGAGGLAAGWPLNGTALVTTTPSTTAFKPEILSDGAGGFFAAWPQGVPGMNLNVVARRYGASGAPLWPGFTTVSSLGSADAVSMLADATSLYVAYGQFANWGSWLQRMAVSNGALQWGGYSPYGVQVGPSYGDSSAPPMVSDKTGGVILAIEQIVSSGGTLTASVTITDYNSSGSNVWSQTPCSGTYGGTYPFDHPWLASDGRGGAIAAWKDNRNGTIDLFSMQVDAQGAPAFGWPAGGQVVATNVGTAGTRLCSDGRGSAAVVWGGGDIKARELAGLSGFGPVTNLCVDGTMQDWPAMDLASTGTMIAAWRDDRTAGANTGVYANSFVLPAVPFTITPTVSSSTINAVASWVGPGPDPVWGPPTAFEVRRASTPITEATWALASSMGVVPASYPAGTTYCSDATPLARCTNYFYAMRTYFGTVTYGLGTTSSKTKCSGNFLYDCEPPVFGPRPAPAEESIPVHALEFTLSSANPASDRATFQLSVPSGHAGEALHVGIYDVAGRQVRSLTTGTGLEGERSIAWDLRAASGERVANGAYFARMVLGGTVLTRTVLVTR